MAKIIRMPQLLEITGISRAHIYALINRREFPRPIRLGQRAVGWLTTDIDAWLKTRPLAGDWKKGGGEPRAIPEGHIAKSGDH